QLRTQPPKEPARHVGELRCGGLAAVLKRRCNIAPAHDSIAAVPEESQRSFGTEVVQVAELGPRAHEASTEDSLHGELKREMQDKVTAEFAHLSQKRERILYVLDDIKQKYGVEPGIGLWLSDEE